MKRAICFSALSLIFLISCVPESDEVLLEEANLAVSEYFTAHINGKEFVVTDPELMGGIIFTNPGTGVISLDLYGEKETGDTGEGLEGIYFKLYSYDKEKITYYTGNTQDVSYADYRKGWDLYCNDYTLRDPGEVKILNATEAFVEGEFVFRAYNVDAVEEIIEITGNFGVVISNRNKYY